MGQFLQNIQYKLKTSSLSIFLLALKVFVGAVVGLTLALIGQEIIQYKHFVFFMVIVATVFTFLRISKKWSYAGVIVFAVVCVLLGLLVQMYIRLAPGA